MSRHRDEDNPATSLRSDGGVVPGAAPKANAPTQAVRKHALDRRTLGRAAPGKVTLLKEKARAAIGFIKGS